MKPLSLELAAVGLLGSKSIDFSTKADGLALVAGNAGEIKESLFLALFGGGESGKLTYSFSDSGEKYMVFRDFSEETASISKNGETLAQGIPQTNAFLAKFIGICKDAYAGIFTVDREQAVKAFSADDSEKIDYINSLFSVFSPGREDVFEVKAAVKEKYDKLAMKLELTEPVEQSSLLAVKTETEEAIAEKAILQAEIDTLIDEKNKGIAAKAVLASLQKVQNEKEKLLGNSSDIENLRFRLLSSGKAETIDALNRSRESLLSEKANLERRIAELTTQYDNNKINIANGAKSKNKLENELVHRLSRIDELRKKLYDIFDGDSCASVKKDTERIFAEDEKDISILSAHKKELDKEYEASAAAFGELQQKLLALKISQQTRVAIRDGAVLEMTLSKLDEEIAVCQNGITSCNSRLSEIEPETKQLKEGIAGAKSTVKEINKILLSTAGSKEETVNNAVIRKQSLYQSHIFVSTQEKEIVAIGSKIIENERGLVRYYEDTAALSSAEKGLEAYVSQVKEKLSLLEKELLTLKSELLFFQELHDVEYGEKCPVCRSIVLHKEEGESTKTRLKYEKTVKEYEKGCAVLAEYEEKRVQLANKIGELAARITTSESYIASLKNSITTREELIAEALAAAGATDSVDLERKLKEAILYSNSLAKLIADLAASEGAVKTQESALGLLLEEKNRLEETELPRLNQRYLALRSELEQVETGYEVLAGFLDGKSAIEWLNELILIEKEEDTLREEITEKREKLLKLLEEKEQINSTLVLLSARNRKTTIDGKEKDYVEVVTNCISSKAKELVAEIQKSEREAEDFKVELAAVRRVFLKAEEAEQEIESTLAELQSTSDFCAKALAELEKELAELLGALGGNANEVRAMLLSDEEKTALSAKIKAYDEQVAKLNGIAENLEATLSSGSNFAEALDENIALLADKKQRLELLHEKTAELSAKHKELTSRAALIQDLKSQYAAIGERLKYLTELGENVTDNQTFLKYLNKKAAKIITYISGGKYALESGSLLNTNNKKAVTAGEGSPEEKLTFALAYAASLYESFATMLGGDKPYLLFPLHEKEDDKHSAKVLINYAAKNNLIVLAQNSGFASSLNKVLI